METRIYLVQTKGKEAPEDTVLVEAQTPAQAIRVVTQAAFDVRVATARETANYIKAGARIISATPTEAAPEAAVEHVAEKAEPTHVTN